MPASRPSPALALDALRRRWRAMFGRMPPAALSKEHVQLSRCKPDLPEVRWRQKRMRQRSVWDNEGRADPLEVAFHQEASPVLATTFPVLLNWQPPLRRCSPCSAKKQRRDVSD